MNLSTKRFSNKDVKLITPNKVITLNPNAAEFVPSALRSTFGNTKNADPTRLDVPGSSGNAAQDRSESSVSNNSDDEAHQYWCHQLPDDITPDFKVAGEDELQRPEQISLAGLSINDGIEDSRFSASPTSQLMRPEEDVYAPGLDSLNFSGKTRYSNTTSAEDRLSAALMTLVSNNRDRQFITGDQQFMKGGEGHFHNVDSNGAFSNALLSEQAALKHTAISPLGYLVSKFPAFTAEDLADVYCANSCDLNSTIDMLSQLELRHVKFSQNLSSKALVSPSLSMLDFPASPVAELHDREDIQQALNPYRSSSSVSRGAIDFSSMVRKQGSQDSDRWRYERNGSAVGGVGSSRSSQSITSLDNENGKSFLRDKFQNSGAAQTPSWLGTGDAVARAYPDSREEALDFTHLRNMFLEQQRQAKELSIKGNSYDMQTRAAHGKSRETIYQQRNPVGSEIQGYIRGQNPLIDLHGLHVSEAIHVVKHELGILRNMARSTRQQLQVMICVGTGHHTRGSSRAPARLPLAIEQYLLEEGLHYTQPHPGLLRVVIY